MRYSNAIIFLILLGFFPTIGENQEYTDNSRNVDYPQWNVPEYTGANSAQNEDYLSADEKLVYYYLNLVRLNPKLFADTYLDYLKNSTNFYESSLYKELQRIEPRPILKPTRKLFESAQCHAIESGERGFVGHERFKCDEYFMGECIHYGQSEALEIVTSLLIDQSVNSLGHRKICLGYFTEMGVSIQPHNGFGKNAVLDFR